MHPQASKIENFTVRLPHTSQLNSWVLAGVLTLLLIGSEGMLEIKSAYASTIDTEEATSDEAIATSEPIHAATTTAPIEVVTPQAQSSGNLPSIEMDAPTSLPELEFSAGLPPAPDVMTNVTDEAINTFADTTDLTPIEFQTVESPAPALYTPNQVSNASLSIASGRITDTSSVATRETALSEAALSEATPTREAALSSEAVLSSEATATREATPTRETAITQPAASLLAQTQPLSQPSTAEQNRSSSVLGTPLLRAQAAYVLQDGESSGRLRLTGTYVATPNLLFGATVDLAAGENFTESDDVEFDVNELYFTVSPSSLPNLRFTAGMIDLTSYFDRNSFAKDSVTHFFHPVFQTNPALAASGIGSRPGALVNWDITDNLNVKAAAFSSSRDLGDFSVDGFAGEVGLRLGNFIVRGTYATDRDAGQNDGFQEIFQFSRGDNQFGLQSGDREQAFGINAEVFIPELNLGLFGRYGHYQNLALDRGGNTYSFGLNFLDLLLPDDRLGLAYGRQLSNDNLRQDGDGEIPDVLELFYDVRLSSNFRAGVTIQERDGFSETVLGLRIRADFDVK